MYDIAAHYEHEASRGVEFVSPMARAMGGPAMFEALSPIHLFSRAIAAESRHKSRRRAGPRLPPLLLIHGDDDTTVPLASTLALARAAVSATHVEVCTLKGSSHVDPLFALMTETHAAHAEVLAAIIKHTSLQT